MRRYPMTKQNSFTRVIAFLVALHLFLPSPALALRTREADELPETRSGLEEALQRSASPDAALNAIGRVAESLLPKTLTPVVSTAGMEEANLKVVRRLLKALDTAEKSEAVKDIERLLVDPLTGFLPIKQVPSASENRGPFQGIEWLDTFFTEEEKTKGVISTSYDWATSLFLEASIQHRVLRDDPELGPILRDWERKNEEFYRQIKQRGTSLKSFVSGIQAVAGSRRIGDKKWQAVIGFARQTLQKVGNVDRLLTGWQALEDRYQIIKRLVPPSAVPERVDAPQRKPTGWRITRREVAWFGTVGLLLGIGITAARLHFSQPPGEKPLEVRIGDRRPIPRAIRLDQGLEFELDLPNPVRTPRRIRWVVAFVKPDSTLDFSGEIEVLPGEGRSYPVRVTGQVLRARVSPGDWTLTITLFDAEENQLEILHSGPVTVVRPAGLEESLESAPMEPLDPAVRDLLLRFEREPDSGARFSLLAQGLPVLQPQQRGAFLIALPFLSDQEKVSDLISSAFISKNPVPSQVRDQLMLAVQEGKPPLTIPVLRVLLAELPSDQATEVVRKFYALIGKEDEYKPGWERAGPYFMFYSGIAIREAGIGSVGRTLGHDAEFHAALAHIRGELAKIYREEGKGVFHRIEHLELTLAVIHAAVVQHLTGIRFGDRELYDPEVRRAYEGIIQSSIHTVGQSPILRIAELEKWIELEETYGDYLKAKHDLSHLSHHHEAQQLRKERGDWLVQQRKALGLAPAAGLEENTLAPRQIYQRLGPLLLNAPAQVLALDVEGVLTPAFPIGQNMSEATGRLLTHFLQRGPIRTLVPVSADSLDGIRRRVASRFDPSVQDKILPFSVANPENPSKGAVLWRLAQQGVIRPEWTLYVDDTAKHIRQFPEVDRWRGLIISLDKYDPTLPKNVIQIAGPGEPKPSNTDEIARVIIALTAAMQEVPESTVLRPAIAAVRASEKINGHLEPSEFVIRRGRLEQFLPAETDRLHEPNEALTALKRYAQAGQIDNLTFLASGRLVTFKAEPFDEEAVRKLLEQVAADSLSGVAAFQWIGAAGREIEVRPAVFWFQNAPRVKEVHHWILKVRREGKPQALPALLKIMNRRGILDDVRVAAARALPAIGLKRREDFRKALRAVVQLIEQNDNPPSDRYAGLPAQLAEELVPFDPGPPNSERRVRFRRQLNQVERDLWARLARVPAAGLEEKVSNLLKTILGEADPAQRIKQLADRNSGLPGLSQEQREAFLDAAYWLSDRPELSEVIAASFRLENNPDANVVRGQLFQTFKEMAAVHADRWIVVVKELLVGRPYDELLQVNQALTRAFFVGRTPILRWEWIAGSMMLLVQDSIIEKGLREARVETVQSESERYLALEELYSQRAGLYERHYERGRGREIAVPIEQKFDALVKIIWTELFNQEASEKPRDIDEMRAENADRAFPEFYEPLKTVFEENRRRVPETIIQAEMLKRLIELERLYSTYLELRPDLGNPVEHRGRADEFSRQLEELRRQQQKEFLEREEASPWRIGDRFLLRGTIFGDVIKEIDVVDAHYQRVHLVGDLPTTWVSFGVLSRWEKLPPATAGLEKVVRDAGEAIRQVLPQFKFEEATQAAEGHLLLKEAALAALFFLHEPPARPSPNVAVVELKKLDILRAIARAARYSEGQIRDWERDYLIPYDARALNGEEDAIEQAKGFVRKRLDERGFLSDDSHIEIIPDLPRVLEEFGARLESILRSFGFTFQSGTLGGSVLQALYQAAQA